MQNTPDKKIVLAILVVLIVGSIIYLESRKVDTSGGDSADAEIEERVGLSESDMDRIARKESKFEKAKEITTPNAFINVDRINISDLIGEKVVLVDFWTYSCINCQRTLPHLNSWHKSYEDDGLVIIGVHTPEFEFEKELENVQKAVDKFGVEYPVVLDNDYSTWRSYKNRYWPRKYLIDIDGFVVYDHIGEGSYDETEAEIVKALQERKRVLGLSDEIEAEGEGPEEANLSGVRTPEIYFGSSRLEYLQNLPSRMCFGITCDYEGTNKVGVNRFELDGEWRIEKENAVLVSETGKITLNFNAKDVNIVAGSVDEKPVNLKIYLNGELVPEENAGGDVSSGEVTVTGHDLYHLISLPESGPHVLEIEIEDAGLEVFTFTFG